MKKILIFVLLAVTSCAYRAGYQAGLREVAYQAPGTEVRRAPADTVGASAPDTVQAPLPLAIKASPVDTAGKAKKAAVVASPDTTRRGAPVIESKVKLSSTDVLEEERLPLTVLYGDPSLGYVQNRTENKFLRCWWLPQSCANKVARPGQKPDFVLAPGFVKEFRLQGPRRWLYVEAYYSDSFGLHPAGQPAWKSFEVSVPTTVGYDGWYGWRLEISSW